MNTWRLLPGTRWLSLGTRSVDVSEIVRIVSQPVHTPDIWLAVDQGHCVLNPSLRSELWLIQIFDTEDKTRFQSLTIEWCMSDRICHRTVHCMGHWMGINICYRSSQVLSRRRSRIRSEHSWWDVRMIYVSETELIPIQSTHSLVSFHCVLWTLAINRKVVFSSLTSSC